MLLLELSLGFVLSTAPLLLELLSGLLSGAGLSSGLLFPGTVSLSFLCLVYSSNALSMLDFSSKILSIDFSSSYTFWAFSVASFNLAYASLLTPSLSLSSLTKILAVSKGKRRFALSVANFFATSSLSFSVGLLSLGVSTLSLGVSTLSLGLLASLLDGVSTLSLGLLASLLDGVSTLSLGLLTSLLDGVSTLSLGLLTSPLVGVSTLSLGLLASLLAGVSTLSLGLLTSLLDGVSTLSLGLLVSLLLDVSVLPLGLFASGAGASFNPLTASSISFNKLERVSSRFLVSLALFMNSVALVIAVVKLFFDSSE